jgi:hypothetical protein
MERETLYRRLFKYQSTDIHSKKENFLTEALCDLLSRWKPAQVNCFINEVLGLNSWNSSRKFGHVIWASQQTGSESRPDLVGYVGKRPFVAVENKVDAEFTVKQLVGHGKWVRRESEGKGALVCLTARHTPPSDFLDANSQRYAVTSDLRILCSWSKVQNWLKSHADLELASEFATFLMEEGMDAITPDDFEHLKGYLENELARKVDNMMAWAFSNAIKQTIGVKRKPQVKWMDGCVFSYYRFSKGKLKGVEIQWGFSPGNNEETFDRDLGAEMFAFVGMWAPASRLKSFGGAMKPWMRIFGGEFWAQTIPAKQLTAKPDPNEEFSAWLKPRILDAKARLSAL